MPDATIRERLRLVGDTGVQQGLVGVLETLLQGAKNGQIVGIAFAAVLQRQRFVTDVAGTCERHVTHARGMVRALDDKLRYLYEDRDPADDR